MAYILVGMNFFMQTVLVWMVYEAIVSANISWQNGILELKGHALFDSGPRTGCNTGSSLCSVMEETFHALLPACNLQV